MKARRCDYLMFEMAAALAVLSVLGACFIASMRTLADMDRSFVAESKAILALDNSLERASGLGKPAKHGDLKRIFDSEFSKSALAGSGAKAVFEFKDGVAGMRILKANGKPLAEVSLKCE